MGFLYSREMQFAICLMERLLRVYVSVTSSYEACECSRPALRRTYFCFCLCFFSFLYCALFLTLSLSLGCCRRQPRRRSTLLGLTLVSLFKPAKIKRGYLSSPATFPSFLPLPHRDMPSHESCVPCPRREGTSPSCARGWLSALCSLLVPRTPKTSPIPTCHGPNGRSQRYHWTVLSPLC